MILEIESALVCFARKTKIAGEFGSDSDPRAFNFDGEFNVANRGMIEVLKLDVAFLYDLLGASQEHKIKPQ